MAFYELKCKKCNHRYEIMCMMANKEKETKKAKCEKCGSTSKQPIISACNHNFTDPVGTDRWNSSSGGHGYRFDHGLPKKKKEREQAEIMSHMGTDPYGQSDMVNNDIEMDTGIHDAEEGPTMLTEYN